MGVSSVCVEEGERRSEEEVGRSVGRSSVVGRRSVGRSAGAAPKVRTPHNDVGKKRSNLPAHFPKHPASTYCENHPGQEVSTVQRLASMRLRV